MAPGEILFELANVSIDVEQGFGHLQNANLALRRHEITGIAGVSGNGQQALAALLSGAYRPEPQERVAVLICGGNISPDPLGA